MPSPSNTVELRVELHWPDDLQAWLNDAALDEHPAADRRAGQERTWNVSI